MVVLPDQLVDLNNAIIFLSHRAWSVQFTVEEDRPSTPVIASFLCFV